jgi:hypothetical protein
MSARNPTTFNMYVDEATLEQGTTIITTAPSQVADDQVFVLDVQELIVSDYFNAQGFTAGAFATFYTYKLESKDMCDVAGVSNNEIAHYLQVYAWVSAGGTTGEVRATSSLATASTSATATINSTTKQWVAGAAALNIKTNGNEDTITIEVRRTAGAGTVYLAGVAIFAGET